MDDDLVQSQYQDHASSSNSKQRSHSTPHEELSEPSLADFTRVEAENSSDSEEANDSSSSPNNNDTPEDDGLLPMEGKWAWVNVLGSFLTQFICLGNMYAVSVFFTRYLEYYPEVGVADVSLIYQLQVALFMAGGFVSGRVSDQVGIKPVFIFGLVFYAAGLLLASFAVELWQTIVCHGLLVGLGHGALYWPAISVIPMWFEKRRALALGICVFGGGIGNFVMGVVVEDLLDKGGFRFALRIILIYSIVVLFLAMFCLKRRLPNIKHTTWCFDFALFRDRNWVLFAAASMFFQCAYNLPFAALATYCESQGHDSTFAAFAVGAIGIGSAIGRISLGVVADYLGRVRTFQGLIWGTAAALLIWNACTSQGAILFFAIYFGFVSGGFIALMPAVTAYFYGVHQLGTVMGSFVLFLVPGSFVGPYVAGALYDKSGTYWVAIWIFAAVEVIAAIIFSFLDLTDTYEAKLARAAASSEDSTDPESGVRHFDSRSDVASTPESPRAQKSSSAKKRNTPKHDDEIEEATIIAQV